MSIAFRYKIAGLIAVFGIGSAILRFWALSKTEFANGWDSYFYLVQLKSLVETGRMHSPEASLFYPILQLAFAATGDYVLAIKVAAAVFAGFFTVLVMVWAATRGGPYPMGSAVVAGAWTIYSPHLTWFCAQFAKNLMGLDLFLLFILAISWAEKRRWSIGSIGLVVLIGGLNYFAHRLTFGMCGLYLLCYVGFYFRWRVRNLCMYGAAIAVVLIGVICLSGHFFPGLLAFSDAKRIGSVVARAQFPVYSFWKSYAASDRLTGAWGIEIIAMTAGCFCLVGCSFFGKIRTSTAEKAVIMVTTLLCFPFLEWSLTGLSFRLFAVFILLVPMLFPLVVRLITAKPSGKYGIAAISGVLLAAAFFSKNSYAPEKHDPDYGVFKGISHRVVDHLRDKNPELVIAHNALAEYITFATPIEAMPWLPEYAISEPKLWRIAQGISDREARYVLGNSDADVVAVGPGYILLLESNWQKILQTARNAGDEALLSKIDHWRNPSKIRPQYLLNRKK